MTKGVDSNLPGWQPKETRPNCRTTAGPTAETTPLFRDAQKPWGGHPLCGRPAGYLPSGTVGQWPLATGQWWTEQKGGHPRTDKAIKGTTRTPGWHPKEKEAQLPLVTKRYFCMSMGEGPQMLKQTTNFNVSLNLRAILQKSFENPMILCGERCSLSLRLSRGPWLVGVVCGPVLLS